MSRLYKEGHRLRLLMFVVSTCLRAARTGRQPLPKVLFGSLTTTKRLWSKQQEIVNKRERKTLTP